MVIMGAIITKLISDREFSKLQVPAIGDDLIGEPLFRLLQIQCQIYDLNLHYVPDYYYAAYLLAIQQN